MKKNISILIYSLAGGGAERVVSILLKELHKQQEYYNLHLVLMNEKIDYEIPKDLKIHFLEKSKATESGILKLIKLPILGLKYKKFIKKNNIDVSFAFMTRPSYISLISKILTVPKNRIKTVISERTTPSQMYKSRSFKSKINKFLIKRLYPKADKIIANSKGNEEDLIKNFNISESKIETIYNLFDVENIRKKAGLEIDKLELFNSEKFFNLITVGRLDDGKNHQLIISAFAKIRENLEIQKALKNRKLQLFILGSGELESKLQEQIESLNLEDSVYLLGFDSNPYKYLMRSHIFVFASLFEGFPNVLVEALSCDLPIISTDCKSGPREILAPSTVFKHKNKKILIKNSNNGIDIEDYGILTDLNNIESLNFALETLILNENLRKKYREKAKKRALEFDKNQILETYLNIIK